jgi:hypothetical protein
MTNDPLEAIREGLDAIEAELTRRRDAFEYAFGLAADDFDAPSVLAEVNHACLTDVILPDDLSDLPAQDAETIVNGVVIAAFKDWYLRYDSLLNGEEGGG